MSSFTIYRISGPEKESVTKILEKEMEGVGKEEGGGKVKKWERGQKKEDIKKNLHQQNASRNNLGTRRRHANRKDKNLQ